MISTWHLFIIVLITLALQYRDEGSTPQNEPIAVPVTSIHHGDVKPIDLSRSIVKWRGTKLMGAGSHEGTINFREGGLRFSGGRLTGGECIVNMKSIYNTDIPLTDPEPRKNLTRHLNSDFNTDSFPQAGFTITSVKETKSGELSIEGKMTIMGHVHPLIFSAREFIPGREYRADIVFNRSDWHIGENGSWLEQKLVDNEVALSVLIIVM